MPAPEVELDWCMHGVSLKTIRDAWNEEYKRRHGSDVAGDRGMGCLSG